MKIEIETKYNIGDKVAMVFTERMHNQFTKKLIIVTGIISAIRAERQDDIKNSHQHINYIMSTNKKGLFPDWTGEQYIYKNEKEAMKAIEKVKGDN